MNLKAFSGFWDCLIVVAEPDVLDHPNTTGFVSLALITNTAFFNPSIKDHLQQFDQVPPDVYPGTFP
ncbi:MAG: hypothetical protein NTZ53_00850 [Cyanobacteria bacterium]|nr:hypothetical protein [Cyanobacteriota bacterium]